MTVMGEIRNFILLNKIELVAYEAPLMSKKSDKRKEDGGFVMNEATALVLICMAGFAATAAKSCHVPSHKVSVQTARKNFVGHGRPNDPKQVVMDRCRQLGWPAPNTDASDAICVWYWAKSNFDRSFRVETGTPLFGRRAAE